MVERVHRWHIAFLEAEIRSGRRVWYRDLDAATERSGWARSRIASGELAQLRLDAPLVVYQTPATELAIAFVSDRADDVLRDRPARSILDRLYGPDIVEAYRKSLSDLLTRAFELELLAEASQRSLASEVDVVPDAVRDVDDALTGQRLTRGWAHPLRRPARFGIPAWLALVHAAHRRARGIRATVSIIAGALGPADPPGDPERAAIAFAVVSRAREVPPSRRAAGYLIDERLVRSADTVFIPMFEATADELAELRGRGLRVAVAGRGRPDRLAYFGIALAHALRADRYARAAAELVRTHRQWGGIISRYRFGTFVSIADFGLPAVARNVLFAARGIRTVAYTDSANHGFHAGGDQRSAGHPIPHFTFLRYDAFATWNDRLLRFMKAHAQNVREYHVIGCQWSDIVAAARRDAVTSPVRRELRARAGDGRHVLAIFDSWYHPQGVNTADDLGLFLSDILRLLDARPRLFVALKKKVPIKFPERDAERIYALHDRIERHPRAHVFPPSMDATEIVAASDAVICFPFTSVALEALPAGIPGAFYDAADKLRGWYFDRFPGTFLHGYAELLDGVERMLTEDPAIFLGRIVAAQERPTELYLELGGLERLRRLIAG